MSPTEIFEETALQFTAVWPQDPSRTWESMYDGQSASLERISKLLARHIDATEVVVLVHSDPGVGAIVSRDAAANLIVEHFLKADVQVSNRTFTSFVEISRIGVGTGWRKDTKDA